jgi:hypothetical protein
MIFYFYKVANSEIYYIDKSKLDFKKYVKQLKKEYINYKKNKTGDRDIFDLLESDDFEITKIDCCYGTEQFASETYKEILNNLYKKKYILCRIITGLTSWKSKNKLRLFLSFFIYFT